MEFLCLLWKGSTLDNSITHGSTFWTLHEKQIQHVETIGEARNPDPACALLSAGSISRITLRWPRRDQAQTWNGLSCSAGFSHLLSACTLEWTRSQHTGAISISDMLPNSKRGKESCREWGNICFIHAYVHSVQSCQLHWWKYWVPLLHEID